MAGFDQFDLDGDGVIDADEHLKSKTAQIDFKRLDTDGDGKVSREEWIAKYGSADGFDQYDLGHCHPNSSPLDLLSSPPVALYAWSCLVSFHNALSRLLSHR